MLTYRVFPLPFFLPSKTISDHILPPRHTISITYFLFTTFIQIFFLCFLSPLQAKLYTLPSTLPDTPFVTYVFSRHRSQDYFSFPERYSPLSNRFLFPLFPLLDFTSACALSSFNSITTFLASSFSSPILTPQRPIIVAKQLAIEAFHVCLAGPGYVTDVRHVEVKYRSQPRSSVLGKTHNFTVIHFVMIGMFTSIKSRIFFICCLFVVHTTLARETVSTASRWYCPSWTTQRFE